MRQYKTHTPEGALDILADECAIKRDVENKIKSVFYQSGYLEVQTPTFEYYDVFADEIGEVGQTSMIKFFDRQGRIMALRPDITTPIARLVATKLKDAPLPQRICYVGSAFRDGDSMAGTIQKEFTQAGIELVGKNCPEADAEVIALTIKALKKIGLTEFQLDIGQVEFFKGVMEQTGLNDADIEKMRVLIDRKSFVGMREIIEKCNLSEGLKNLILDMPNMFGEVEIVHNIDRTLLSERASSALDNLLSVYNIIVDYGFENYVSIDLGMVQGINYYTGIIVKGFTTGVGFPICGGGRYDNLIGEFGIEIPATGIAIGIERVISALEYGKVEFETPVVHTLICYENARVTALKIAEGLRGNGLCVEMWLGGDNYKDYARQKGIGGIVHVIDDENIEIINLNDNTVVKTSIFELMGGCEE